MTLENIFHHLAPRLLVLKFKSCILEPTAQPWVCELKLK